MSRLAPFRVRLWDIDASDRGRDNQVAVIEDAIDVGVSAYANEAGEMFFTLPANHAQISECLPLERHYEVTRLNETTGDYDFVGAGLLEDRDESADEVVFYGIDYLGMFTKNILLNNASYTSMLIGTIINNQFTAAQAVDVFAHYVKGTIDATSRTVTMITTFEERLSFWRGLLEILAAGGTTRPLVQIRRSYPVTFDFDENAGSDKTDVRLEYGGAILNFRHTLGYANLATRIRAIGVKREGATVLYADQTYGDTTRFGTLYMSGLFTDLISQAEHDSKSLSALKDAYNRGGNLSLSLAQGYIRPWDGWEIGDSVPVVIQRGVTDIDQLHTVWGMEWIGRRDGSESLYLDLQPKLT